MLGILKWITSMEVLLMWVKEVNTKENKMNDKWSSSPNEGEIADNTKKSHIVYQTKQNQQR